MSDPAREEQGVIGLGQGLGFEAEIGEKIPRMVERHDDHDQAAHDIKRNDAA